jgi:hypothetical protein
MLYLFQDVGTGKVVELDYPMGKAPKIGSSISKSGMTLVRIPVIPEGLVRPDAKFVSHSLPRNWPHAKDHEPGTGKPRFNSIHEVREAEAKSRDTKADAVAYD